MKFTWLLIQFSVLTSFAYGQPSPPDTDCGNVRDFFAIVTHLGKGRNCSDAIVINAVYGSYSALATFEEPANNIYFKTNVDLSNFSEYDLNNNGYIHFIEVSRASSDSLLPGIEHMILDAIVSFDSINQSFSLIVNYQSNGVNDSVVIELKEYYPIFDVTIKWVNSGCIYLDDQCNAEFGQLEVTVNYDIEEFVRFVDQLNFQVEGSSFIRNSEYWKASSIYWGELENSNLTDGEFVLSKPSS